MLDSIKAHPWMTLTMVVFTLVGVWVGLEYGESEWSVARRVLAGALGGIGAGLTVVTTRIIGAFGDDA